MRLITFSGTGNSLEVARRIAAAFPDATVESVLQLLGTDEPIVLDGMVGFVFPIHVNGLPRPVRKFIETVDLANVEYLFACATHGGYPGNVGGQINRILKRSSNSPEATRLLDEFFSIELINNTPKGVAPRPLMRMHWERDIAPKHVERMQRRLDDELPGIIAAIAARTHGYADQYRSERNARGSLIQRFIWRLADGSAPKLDFKLDESACTRCGLCETVCLSRRVAMVNGWPTWPREKECYYCYACFNVCPEQAIGVRHYTKKEGRYLFPGTTAEMLAAQKPVR
ncbi:MAG: EFR1 family ferrodoxin [Spirochaeta sp.]|nr:EFR1 family ferrodoxin [Spirochaeta sp.]